jgi:hypothetical protein
VQHVWARRCGAKRRARVGIYEISLVTSTTSQRLILTVEYPGSRIKIAVKLSDTNLFKEQYRVIAVEDERLVIKGIITGTVLTITNGYPGIPLTSEEYPLGKLVALSDPSASAPN